jgi:hypothetical protein
MRKSVGLLVAVFAVALVCAACGSSGSSSASSKTVTSCGGATGPTVTTAKYVMSLNVGPEETMYTQQQAAASHPTDGEVMISGTMSMTDSTGTVRHLEVHICQHDGTVVQHADPTITVQDAAGGQPVDVSPAVMEGVNEGLKDLHYGNNVNIVPGHEYDVTVGLDGDTANFQTSLG